MKSVNSTNTNQDKQGKAKQYLIKYETATGEHMGKASRKKHHSRSKADQEQESN